MKEYEIDHLLNIQTCGDQDGFNKSFHYHRYEPTPYSALELLFEKYKLKTNDRVVDFGCGKGRLNFYINYLFNATVIGIEMNELYYKEAIENRIQYIRKFKNRKEKIQFICCLAQDYQINPIDNRFYFFNPFSIQIFINIINNILQSFEEAERNIELVLYYASEDYLYFLENQTSFELKEEVIVKDAYKKDPFEKFYIYQLVF